MKITLNTNDKHNISKEFLLVENSGETLIVDPETGLAVAKLVLQTAIGEVAPYGVFLVFQGASKDAERLYWSDKNAVCVMK